MTCARVLLILALTAASPLAAAQGQGGGEARLVAQRAAFSIFVRGMRIGSENLSVERIDGGWLLSGSSRLEAPIDLTLRQAEVRYDQELRPKAFRLAGQVKGQAIDLTTVFDGGTALTTFPQAGETRELRVNVSADTVVLPNNFFGAYAALAARLARSQPGADLRVFVAPEAEISAVLKDVVMERVQTASRAFALRRHTVAFQNPGGIVEVVVETEEDGTLVRVSIPAVQLQVSREDVASVASRAQTYFRDGDEEVRIPANGFNLAATFSRPRPLPPPPPGKKVARLPAILLVPGSGPVDRDQVVAGIPTFGQLSGALADAGFLVVRYDKRGIGQSGGRAEAATLSDYADDVVVVARWLFNRDDVDAKNVTVVGHSEGASVALLAATREKDIARVVSLAGPGTPGAQLILEQQAAALARLPISDAERQQKIELQTKIQAAVLSGKWEGVPDELRKQADSPWFASVLAFDPSQVVSRVRQPLLVIAAERDRQVPAHHATLLAGFAKTRKRDAGVTVVTLPGLNHLFVPATTGEVDEYSSLPDRHVSPLVAETIVRWIHGR